MKTQTLKLFLSLTLALSLFACKKDETTPTPIDQSPTKMVKQVTASPDDFISYEYDAAGHVIKYVSKWQNGAGGTSSSNNVFEYNGDKLSRFSNQSGFALFTYNGNTIARSDNFAANGKKISTSLYQFEGNKLTSIIEQNANPEPDAIIETKVSYQYYSNGNVSRIDQAYRKQTSDPFTVTSSQVFVEYDDKKNPQPDGVLGFFLPGVILQKNNPIKVNNLSANGTIDGYSRYEYTYNSNGYPAKRKHFIAAGNTESTPVVFDYIY
ncbi:hypothetical protein [Segetibacter aerophilus]|uniref:YD repeat-containing protein n=1 Tax=Segetibacter aerophilus TaxID=670293 RepID=A0A512BJN9_9BACT|nr:hypothetical protein [Segetibacter aerophilus]GEO12178.1 hypothetical protein SAE01_46740 [Segetibacter aerophilus]